MARSNPPPSACPDPFSAGRAAAWLPPGYRFVATLSAGEQGEVLRAERAGVEVVLRLLPQEASGAALLELEVLAAVRHPGLARLVDFGQLADGRVFVARAWIAGETLAARAARQGPAELGLLVARLTPALEALHRRGFVHADLKPTNVIVGPDDTPVLTDFGLARRSEGAAAPAAGSLYYVAPEALLGAPLDARADLFALGVMLHEFLCTERAPASAFYARFPREDFLSAAQTPVEGLPEWSRELVLELLERDPARRPSSALEVGRRLASRLGIEAPDGSAGPDLRVPPLAGREAWALERLSARKDQELPRAWTVPPGEDTAELTSALRLALILAGRPAREAQLGARAPGLGDAAALDDWALGTLDEAGAETLLVPLPSGDPWLVRAAEHLARAREQRRGAGERCGELVLLAPRTARLDPALWDLEDLPPVPVAELERLLEGLLEHAEPDRASIAAALAEASGGAAAAASASLERALAAGLLVRGEQRMRLRVGAQDLARFLAASPARTAGAESLPNAPAARELLARLALAGGELPLDEAAQASLSSERFAALLEDLVATRHLELGRERGVLQVRARRPAGWKGLGLDEARWRALATERARLLEARGEPARIRLPIELRSDPGRAQLARALEEAARLREAGLGELALRLVQDAAAALEAAGEPQSSELGGELGETWVALGYPERAEEVARSLEARQDPAERAILERLRGRIALQRGALDQALEHFERAIELEPRAAGPALHARALALYQARRDAELDALVAELEPEQLSQRLAGNLRAIHALSRFRRGEVGAARLELEAELERTARGADRQAEAMTRLNLATILRRTGEGAGAAALLEQAEAIFDSTGHLPGLAQARALLAGVLRDRAELGRADGLLRSAIALRERLGDRTGADAARGMYGLLCAEQGRVRAGLEELATVAQRFDETRRRTDAALARARSAELRARIGEHPPARSSARVSESELTLEADPRILVARARSAWMGGDRPAAADYARRAGELAARLGLVEPREEAELLTALLSQPPGDPSALPGPASTPRVEEDRRILELLGARELDLEPTLRWASELAERGRLDRAARLAVAVAARAAQSELGGRAAALAARSLEACERGLTEAQRRALRNSLLSLPDPFPKDIEGHARSALAVEELEMDVLSLIDINHKLVRQEDLPALLGTIVESAIAVSGAERGFLVLEEDGELAFDTARDSRRGAIDEPELEVSRSILVQALSTMRTVCVSNAVDDPLLGGAPSIAALELRSILCVPLEVQENLRGAIYVDHRIREGAFAERAERLLSLLADQAALAIRQVRRYEEIRALNERLAQRVVERETDLAIARRELARAGAVVPASGLVGSSEPMQRIHRLIERFAPATLSVLVTGQSGTGKELVARALHSLSPRSEGPFVSESCAALPPTLVEAELFGYRKGAFTGADRDREGIFERAHGGTLFLDEIGELAPELQAKLLRVLETGEVRRLGDSRVAQVDFRLVAATNRDLTFEVRDGAFREDLYYRLDALRIELPPLSQRLEDIPDLVQHFLARENARYGAAKVIAPAVVAALCRREWPGNVRELANEVARLCVMSEGDVVDPSLVREARATTPGKRPPEDLVRPLAELEREAIRAALERTAGDKRRAAELLGISRAKIYQRLQDWAQETDEEA